MDTNFGGFGNPSRLHDSPIIGWQVTHKSGITITIRAVRGETKRTRKAVIYFESGIHGRTRDGNREYLQARNLNLQI